MTKILTTLLLTLALTAQAFGAAYMPGPSAVRQILNQGVPNGFASYLGNQVVDHKVQLVKGRYRFAKQGGSSVVVIAACTNCSTIKAALMDEDNGDVVLPWHAVVKQVLVDVLNTPAASTSQPHNVPQFSVGINQAADLFPWTTASTLSGRTAGTPVGTAATMVKVNGTAAGGGSTLQLHMRGGSVTSGDFNVFVEYFLSD